MFACVLLAAAAEVAGLLTGSFSSAAQATADPEFRDVRLHVASVWTDRADGPWLYVEQAIATSLDQPYRQRVYRIVDRRDGAVESRVYTLPDPAKVVGAWRDPAPFASMTPDALVLREGCSIVLRRRDDGSWAGSTGEKTCPSDLRGASWASSEVVLEKARMTSWDRGFDAAGTQVWGATKGGYVFVREEK
jgi:hypothetical protein